MKRPSFAETIRALSLTHPAYGQLHTDAEADLAEVLRFTESIHAGPWDQPDDLGYWGPCVGCGERWPCPVWVEMDALSLLLLGRAHDRVWAHAFARMEALT